MDPRSKYKIRNNKLHRRTYGPWSERTFYEFDPKGKGSKGKNK